MIGGPGSIYFHKTFWELFLDSPGMGIVLWAFLAPSGHQKEGSDRWS